MKKTQTIVDRERLSSDYIESKQDFSNVLSQVKQLPTSATWNSPWFYGPIGIAVFAVTISIVSLNPSNAKVVDTQSQAPAIAKNDVTSPKEAVQNEKPEEVQTSVEIKAINSDEVKIREHKVSTPPVTIAAKQEVEVAELEVEQKKADTPPVEKRIVPINNKYPHIEGVFTGEITLSTLFSKNGIQLNPNVHIVSFDLNYFNGKSNVVKRVDNNLIPKSLHSIIETYNVGQMIFITNIKAVDEMSRLFTLPSLNFKPIKGE